MDKMDQEFFDRREKVFADNFKLVFNPEMFLLGVEIGSDGEVYALSPAHAKRLVAHMTHVIENYEKTHGKIAGAAWSAEIPSPMRFDSDGKK